MSVCCGVGIVEKKSFEKSVRDGGEKGGRNCRKISNNPHKIRPINWLEMSRDGSVCVCVLYTSKFRGNSDEVIS